MAALPQGGSLQGQLSAEAAARSHDAQTPTLEGLEAALQPQGVTFNPPRQLMAKNQLALFCQRADSATGIELTVCEYPSVEQAQRGETEANVVQAKVAGHSSRAHKKSVLHIVARSDAPAGDLDKVNKAFDAL